jgi:hypothetical protein
MYEKSLVDYNLKNGGEWIYSTSVQISKRFMLDVA